MTPDQIITDLENRDERNIIFHDDGIIISFHGQNTVNYWIVVNNELKCIDCKTTSY